MSWRPEGWEHITRYKISPGIYDKHEQETALHFFEAGADAMLEMLNEKCVKVHNFRWETELGTLIFVPDAA